MSILVTGATGFIGRAVLRVLRARGLDHAVFEGDVRDRGDFLDAPACDALIHLAGLTRTDGSYEAQRRLMDVNVTGTLHALDHARRHGAHFVFAGSCNYGRARVIPIPESEPTTAANPYALSKSVCEQAIGAWTRHFGLASATVLRIFNPYGPSQPAGFLVADLVDKIRAGAVAVYNRAAVRDFIFVDDLAELIVRAALARRRGWPWSTRARAGPQRGRGGGHHARPAGAGPAGSRPGAARGHPRERGRRAHRRRPVRLARRNRPAPRVGPCAGRPGAAGSGRGGGTAMNVLAVGAHFDDLELGCGGTLPAMSWPGTG
jgi:UDP-glucose 4-epimerase